MWKTRFKLCSAMVVSVAALARADSTNITPNAEPEPRVYGNRTIDIIGITPGTSADHVAALLTKAYGKAPNIGRSHLVLQYKSVQMTSQEYVNEMDDSKFSGFNSDGTPGPSDSIQVYFGTPSTADTVVGISRVLSFSDPKTAPTVTAMQDALQAKYGAPPQTRTITQQLSNVELGLDDIWSYNETGENQCNGKCSGPVVPMFDPRQQNTYQQSVTNGQVLLLEASLTVEPSDKSRVSTLTVTIDDEGNKLLSIAGAMNQLQAAAVAAYKKTATPGKTPKR